MSDTSQGPGWWQASDGKWYAPELYPKDWPVSNERADRAGAADSSAPSHAAPAAAVSTPPADEPGISVFDTPPDAATALDPAADEPTLVQGVPPISTADIDPTAIQEVVTPTERTTWDPPAASAPPAAPPWEAPGEVPAVEPDVEPTSLSELPPGAPLATPTISSAGPASVPTFEAPPPAESPPPSWDAPADDGTIPLGASAGVAQEVATKGDAAAGLLGLIGGAALAVGSFLSWADAVGPNISGDINGLTGSNGWGTLISGLVVATCGALVWTGQRQTWVRAAMFVAALTGLGLAVGSMLDIQSTSDDLPATLRSSGVDPDIANATSLDLSAGLWIVMAGGVVSLIAGIVALARKPPST